MKQHVLRIILLLLTFLSPSVSNAQNCDNYDCMMQVAKVAYNKGDFVNAFKIFRAAKAFDPSKSKEVDD